MPRLWTEPVMDQSNTASVFDMTSLWISQSSDGCSSVHVALTSGTTKTLAVRAQSALNFRYAWKCAHSSLGRSTATIATEHFRQKNIYSNQHLAVRCLNHTRCIYQCNKSENCIHLTRPIEERALACTAYRQSAASIRTALLIGHPSPDCRPITPLCLGGAVSFPRAPLGPCRLIAPKHPYANTLPFQFLDDLTKVADRAGQTVKFGHDQRITLAGEVHRRPEGNPPPY